MIEIIDTLGQKNNGSFPLVDSNDVRGGYYQVQDIDERNEIPSIRRKEGMLCYVKNDKIYQLTDGIGNENWIEFSVGGTNECKDEIYVGESEPIDESVLWIDTSDIDVSTDVSDSILDEIRDMFSFLQTQVDTLKKKNLELEARVSYLEEHGGGGGINPDPDPDPSDNDILIFEDGSVMIFEDGSKMVFEKNSTVISNPMIFEDGTTMIFEDGSIMAFETDPSSLVGTVLTFEDMTRMVFEDNKYLTFE